MNNQKVVKWMEKYNLKEAFLEAVKEAVRLSIFTLISTVVTMLLTHFEAINDPDYTIFVLTIALRGIDRLIHKSDIELKGILPF